MTAWATPADVLELTGLTVSDSDVGQAQAQIELRVGRTSDVTPYLTATALRWLKQAVAYQAAWMTEQPDLFTRSSVSSFGAGSTGDSVTFRPDGQHLAPLAKRALKRLRWRGTRSVHTPSTITERISAPSPHALGVVGVYDSEDNASFPDDDWRGL